MADAKPQRHLRLVQGEVDPCAITVVHSDTDLDIRELITEELYSALSAPETDRAVQADAVMLKAKLFNNPAVPYLPIAVDMTRVDKDKDGLAVEITPERVTLFPGLIGLEGFDYVTPDIGDKTNIVRLYMGVMLAHRITEAKVDNERFFKMIVLKHFAVGNRRDGEQGLDPRERDVEKLREQFQTKLASFASGVALGTLFGKKGERSAMKEILEDRYEDEKRLDENVLDVTEQRLRIPAAYIPRDNYSAKARGFANPLPMDQVNMILKGRPSKRRG